MWKVYNHQLNQWGMISKETFQWSLDRIKDVLNILTVKDDDKVHYIVYLNNGKTLVYSCEDMGR